MSKRGPKGNTPAQIVQVLRQTELDLVKVRPSKRRSSLTTSPRTLLTRLGTQTALIAPGAPWQNGENERLNGILSQELLSQEVWASVLEAHVMCQQWMQTYNERRPLGPLSMKTPSSFAQEAKQQGCWYHPH